MTVQAKAQTQEPEDAVNPMGTDGFEFVEYTAPDPAALARLFEQLGFTAEARHRSKDVTLFKQGDTNFIVNAEPDSFARRFAEQHGPCACAMAFRVADAGYAFKRAVSLGAKPVETKVGPMELHIPAIEGIGGSLLYFVDRYGDRGSIYDVDFVWTGSGRRDPMGLDYTTSTT
jgi:4-hydroxyphenylpyruvate dioxygenase